MGRKKIIAEDTIGSAIIRKGEKAGEIFDRYFCDDDERHCCAGTSLLIEFAAGIKKQTHNLPALLKELNALPDIK
jgi:iron-sulfur cluster repair protein YtfE (RIC family)